ncbi:ABC transporter substrate-binding protein [Saccharopolyspora sp. HNM0983]|uniref:ABC transporter substrate-binding protein n=1 Tax=Saccharopolyspora montiporae TaxID=2781240 RepID=A0A929B9S0_9PSEU|nr:ABC transporter substrate-binding protein [Saccharopolyspora sp. HNM0983]MBE9374051.1 ABC transporter substrate-binding protein [Saccharopolyspora sp. HNM0983]
MSPMPSAIPRRSLFKIAGGAVAGGAVLGTSGCGLLGGAESADGGNGQVEKANLRVGALPINDLAPLHLGVRNGFFEQEGLSVEIVNASDGGAALSATMGGHYDITYSSYVPFFAVQAQGVKDLKIVADCASAAKNTTVIMTAPDSDVEDAKDLAGKTIAISGPNTISELLVKATMSAHSVDPNTAEYSPIPFINMPAALERGDVDAAILTEPFLTQAARDSNAVPVVDTATGPLEDLPLTGYGATAEFCEQNPKTVAAFQRAMDRSVAASQDRATIEPLLPDFAKIDAETAAIITLLNFNSRADATRLQRVPRLMKEHGFIAEDLDVAGMIVPHPES